jgi:hypothetical protein
MYYMWILYIYIIIYDITWPIWIEMCNRFKDMELEDDVPRVCSILDFSQEWLSPAGGNKPIQTIQLQSKLNSNILDKQNNSI